MTCAPPGWKYSTGREHAWNGWENECAESDEDEGEWTLYNDDPYSESVSGGSESEPESNSKSESETESDSELESESKIRYRVHRLPRLPCRCPSCLSLSNKAAT